MYAIANKKDVIKTNTKQQNRLEAIRQGAEKIRSLNLLSDTFISVVLEDIDACQYVIRKILGTDDIRIISVKGQYRLLNLTAKDAILDAFAQDSTGRQINIEIERRNTVDHARRTRYYGSMIDKSVLDKGAEHEDLPDVYIIYISETDLWHAGETVYTANKSLGKSAIPYNDGNHVIFVNAAVDDGSEVAKMMQYFKKADPDDMSQGDLSKRVRYLKTEKGGYEKMCEVAERIYEQGIEQGIEQGEMTKAKEMALNMYSNGIDDEIIARCANVSPDLVKEWINMQ
ncbi:MAG: PD-(D/E)XK nuclease family transposase [Clostridiales bacterium]|nr:PD-(D/E)XK nuclease family transposase [Clostridiales bacterium]